jgi:Mrp family chromosome partitioning ATPase
MEPIEYLRIIRRRWIVIVAMMLIGLIVGYATASSPPSSNANSASRSSDFRSTAVLSLPASGSDPTGLSLQAMAYLASSGQVPSMTAAALHDGASSQDISSQVSAAMNTNVNVINVTATEPTPALASAVANEFSRQLIAFLNDRLLAEHKSQLATAKSAASLSAALVAKIQSQPVTGFTQSELSEARNQYVSQEVAYLQLLVQGPQHTTLNVIEPALASDASPVITGGGVGHSTIPSGHKTRTALGGLAGLIAGLGLAFVWERLDTRIRTREAAERAFDLPVLAEIPRAHGTRRSRLAVVELPESAAAEGYRMLGTALALSSPTGARQAILFTSPTRLEGKEVLLANLAAAYSELGSSVALVAADAFDLSLPVLVADFTPSATSSLLKAAPPGATGSSDPSRPDGMRTKIDGVSLLLDSTRPEMGNGHVQRHLALVSAGRRMADVVLIDAPPVLSTHDASHLSTVVDSVVLACEIGTVSTRVAALAADGLRRVGAPLLGVVLVGRGALRGAAKSPALLTPSLGVRRSRSSAVHARGEADRVSQP